MAVRRAVAVVCLVIGLGAAGCGDGNGSGGTGGAGGSSGSSGGGGGGSESHVVECYGEAGHCPYGDCNETGPGAAVSCNAYDAHAYNITNVASVCGSQDGGYCVLISNTADGHYDPSQTQYFFVSCASGTGQVHVCINGGCEQNLGCN